MEKEVEEEEEEVEKEEEEVEKEEEEEAISAGRRRLENNAKDK